MKNLLIDQKIDWLKNNGWVYNTGISPSTMRIKWMFDGENVSDMHSRLLFIENGKIKKISEDKNKEGNPLSIDFSDYYVMPGLIDSHAHLSSIFDPFEPNAYIAICGANSATLTTHIIKNAQRCLRMGITCVRDMPGYTNFINQEGIAVREASIRNMIALPRIVAYGWVEPTAGHMDLALPANLRKDQSIYADGPVEVRKMVRRMVREGVDGFKTDLSGGLGGRMEEIWWRKYTDEELIALTDEAHGVGKRVAVHAYTNDSIAQAIRCSVDTIEHGIYLSEEVAEKMAKYGIPLVPTLAVRGDRALQLAQMNGEFTPQQMKKRENILKVQYKSLLTAYKLGVVIATGSDAYFTLRGNYWGLNSEEILLLIKAGLEVKDALKAATSGAAKAVGLEERIGMIESGMNADLIVLKNSPMEKPESLIDPDNIMLVIKNGEFVAGSKYGLQVLARNYLNEQEVVI